MRSFFDIQRKALESKKQAEAKAKAEQKEQERLKQEKARLLAKFEAKTKDEKSELMTQFEASLTIRRMRENYKNNGLESPMLKGAFNNFLTEVFGEKDK